MSITTGRRSGWGPCGLLVAPAELFYAHRPDLLKVKGWDLNEFSLTPKAV